MFMGHLVSGPNDIRVCGRAVALAYEEGRDDASAEDIARRPWLERWPHFIRVRGLEFVDGTLGDCVSLAELMDELGAYAFGPTAENADRGVGNVDPRQSIRQAAAVRLTEAGTSWLEEELESAFGKFGKVRADLVDGLPLRLALADQRQRLALAARAAAGRRELDLEADLEAMAPLQHLVRLGLRPDRQRHLAGL